jgi:hypothetical protein
VSSWTSIPLRVCTIPSGKSDFLARLSVLNQLRADPYPGRLAYRSGGWQAANWRA